MFVYIIINYKYKKYYKMDNAEFSYFHINHKNEMAFLPEDERIEFIMSVYTTLASLDSDDIGKEINKFFNKLIPNNGEDLFAINKQLSEHYFNEYKFNDSQFYHCVNHFLSTDFKMHFEFTKDNTEDLAKLLVFIFKLLSHKSKIKKYNIRNYKDLINAINYYQENNNIDAVNLFLNKEKLKSFNSFISTAPGSIDRRSSEKYEGSVGSKSSFPKMNVYQYPNPATNAIKLSSLELPVELIFILNKFVTVKKLTFCLDCIDRKRKDEILLILLNHEWLFPNVFEVDFNLHDEELETALGLLFKERLNEITNKRQRTTQYDSAIKKQPTWKAKYEEDDDDLLLNYANPNTTEFIQSGEFFPTNSYYTSISPGSSRRASTSLLLNRFSPNKGSKRNSIDDPSSLSQFVGNNMDPFEIVIIYSYFVAQLKNVKLFSLIFQDTFKEEIEKTMEIQGIILLNFNFLNFITKLDKLTELSVEFNSLDMKSFEKIIGLVHKNSELQKLRLSFFVEEKNYSPSGLYKLSSSLKLSIKSLISKSSSTSQKRYYQLSELDQLIVNQLLPSFSENIEKLFFILLTKLNMTELILYFDLPSLITDNEMYIMILIKLIINFFIMLSFDHSSYREVKIIAPYLKFDNRKFPIIEELLDEIVMEKNKKLEHFVLQIQMYKVINVQNLISTHLQKLLLGDLDKDSFTSFMKFYTSKGFIENSELLSIKITLSIIVIIYEEISDLVKQFLMTSTKKLEENALITSLVMKEGENYEDLLNIIYFRSKTNKCVLEVSQSINNENEILQWNKVIKEKIYKTLNALLIVSCKSRYKKLKEKNIFFTFRNFIDIPKTKGIRCKKI